MATKTTRTDVSGVWNRIQLFCFLHGNEPAKFNLMANDEKVKEPYFVCECEDCKNADYKNRITLKDYEAIDRKIEDTMGRLEIGFDMTNFAFELKRKEPASAINVRVAEFTGKAIKLAIK